MEPSSRRPLASGRGFKTPAISARRRRQTNHSHLPVLNDPQTRSTSSSQSFVQSRNMVGARPAPVIWSIDHSESHTWNAETIDEAQFERRTRLVGSDSPGDDKKWDSAMIRGFAFCFFLSLSTRHKPGWNLVNYRSSHEANDKGKKWLVPRSPISNYSNISSSLDETFARESAKHRSLSLSDLSFNDAYIPSYKLRANQPCTHVLRLTRRTAMGLASGQALVLRRRINRICSVFWTLTVAPTLSSSSLASSTIRKAAALHIHIYYFSLFFSFGSVALMSAPSRMLLYLPPHFPQAYILLLHTRPCTYMFFLYIYVYILLSIIFAHIYIWTHCYMRAHIHTHTYTILPYMCIRIYLHTITHILYNRVIC